MKKNDAPAPREQRLTPGSMQATAPAGPPTIRKGDLAPPMKRDEIIDAVAQMLELAPKGQTPPADDAQRRTAHRARPYVLLSIAIVIATFYLVTQLSPWVVRTAPPELIADWVTADARYATRGFSFSEHEVVIRSGNRPHERSAHPILAISRKESGDTAWFNVRYGTHAENTEFNLRYLRGPRPTVVLTHQPMIEWHRFVDVRGVPAAPAEPPRTNPATPAARRPQGS